MDHGQRSGLKGSARATLNLIFLCLVALLGSPAGAQSGTGDRLAPQDTVEIRVSGWSALPGGSAEAPRLTGAFTIGAAGFVELPIIGPVRASGLRADELAKLIADHLQARSDVVEGPVTTIQVKQYPAFAVRGLVERPGKYPYRPNLTVQEAVEAAGGVAQLAQTLSISRSVGREREFTVARNTLVLPGDIISVSQTSAPETLSARTSTNNSSATNTEEREIAMQQSVADSEQKRERSKVDSLQRKYLAARGEVEAVRKEALAARQAARDDAALYSQSLASARQRAASLTQELSAMRADLDAAKAQLALEQNTASRATAQARVVADARALQARALEEQRQRADRLARDLVLAEREVEGLKADAAIAARAKAAALRDRQAAEALANSQNELVERERVKGAALKQEFFAARREIEQLKKSVHPAGDRSGDAVRSELAEAREDLDAMRADLDAAKAQLALEQNTASRATAQARVVADTKVLQARALEEQQKRADRLARDLVLTQREVEGLKTDAAIAARAKAAALRAHQAVEATLADTTRALEEGRQTVKRFGRDLAAASQSIDALEARAKQAAAAAAAALQARQVAEAAAKRASEALAEERERAVLAARDLDSAGKERDAAKQELIRVSEELRAALEQERGKTVGLARDVSTARQSIDALEARAKQAAAAAAAALQARQVAEAAAKRAGEALAEERERAVLAARDLDSAGKERDAAKRVIRVSEELRAALEQERGKTVGLARDVSTARQSIDALEARAKQAAAAAAAALQARQVAEAAAKRAGEALAEERERAVLAARDLDSAGKERDAAKQELIRVSEELRAALEQERGKTIGLARDVSTARKEIGMLKDQAERRTARIEPAPKPRANSKPRVSGKASARPVRQLRSREIRVVEVRNPSRPVRMSTIRLPDILLPTRPPGRGLR